MQKWQWALGGKGKVVPILAWTGLCGSRNLSLPEFLDSQNMKVARLSALCTGHLYPPGEIPGMHFC